ncbi:MAG: hypothetical protein RLW62_01105, partial [Gammaproteobacteria bacterium]
YVEVLIATALLAVILAPAMDALRSGIRAGSVQAAEGALRLRVASCLEEALARAPTVLAAAAASAALGDALAAEIPGTPACQLTVTGWDGDDADGDGNPLTGIDAGLVHIEARVAGARYRATSLVSY